MSFLASLSVISGTNCVSNLCEQENIQGNITRCRQACRQWRGADDCDTLSQWLTETISLFPFKSFVAEQNLQRF